GAAQLQPHLGDLTTLEVNPFLCDVHDGPRCQLAAACSRKRTECEPHGGDLPPAAGGLDSRTGQADDAAGALTNFDRTPDNLNCALVDRSSSGGSYGRVRR